MNFSLISHSAPLFHRDHSFDRSLASRPPNGILGDAVSIASSSHPLTHLGLFFLCNSTQHTGMHHGSSTGVAGGGGKNTTLSVLDFRLTTRSCYLNNGWIFPIVRIWYWHMNYHIEVRKQSIITCLCHDSMPALVM